MSLSTILASDSFDLRWIALLIGVWVLWSISLSKTNLPLGPTALPVLGNLLSMPRNDKARKLRDLAFSKNYGDITYFHGLGQSILILNNQKAMSELLVRRSDVTAGRPTLTMCGELVGYDKAIVLKQPGKEFREMRKALSAAIGKSAATNRDRLLRRQDLGLYLKNISGTPHLVYEHSRWVIGTYTLAIAYGYRPTKYNDNFITAAQRALSEFVDLIQPGTWIVDVLPFLKHVLLRLPFSGYPKEVARYQESQKALSITPWRMVKKQLSNGTAPESICVSLMQEYQTRASTEEGETSLAWIVGNIYAGGSDTTVSSLCSFYLAMCMFPRVQKKAQAEIDAFTECMDRCPNTNEKEQFPYLCALITELYRWAIVAPMGIPHMFVEDVVYNGYHVPKNTTILVNAWAISQDSSIYPDPTEFRPERFLGEKQQLDPREFAFGGGRRLCPGMDLADTMLFFTLSTVLAVYDISPSPESPPMWKFTDKFSRHPLPYPYRITLRSAKSQEWIDDALVE
ncbi:cytochrome P450 [Macrolepiota fuliginosa MF-IS2]|uniref:Cytochrome P450 n=1 Tax=Macrolepiota fuliginosa MF-IS2 TaxID=1400762 RepID=A0A9P6C110_9AGAR|nr:cytochrome P450 [Macrolepiota fuliginosa MF-IS2]